MNVRSQDSASRGDLSLQTGSQAHRTSNIAADSALRELRPIGRERLTGVEDDPVTRTMLVGYFSENSFDVVGAGTCAECRQALRARTFGCASTLFASTTFVCVLILPSPPPLSPPPLALGSPSLASAPHPGRPQPGFQYCRVHCDETVAGAIAIDLRTRSHRFFARDPPDISSARDRGLRQRCAMRG